MGELGQDRKVRCTDTPCDASGGTHPCLVHMARRA